MSLIIQCDSCGSQNVKAPSCIEMVVSRAGQQNAVSTPAHLCQTCVDALLKPKPGTTTTNNALVAFMSAAAAALVRGIIAKESEPKKEEQ